MIEPAGVTVEDGTVLRHDEVWMVLDDGRVRELRLRVGRGKITELTGYTIGSNGLKGPEPGEFRLIHYKDPPQLPAEDLVAYGAVPPYPEPPASPSASEVSPGVSEEAQ